MFMTGIGRFRFRHGTLRALSTQRKQLLRRLPKVDAVLARPQVQALDAPRWAVVEAVRRAVDRRRRAIIAGESDSVEVTAEDVARVAGELVRPSLRRVINATGVVLHTNLGRAPLGREVMERVVEIATHYSNLEYDVDGRARGSRHGHLVGALLDLTGAEDACVVNNNAGAVMLALAALAAGREVVVSRGELIEIGGSFRIPDVMRMSGARLVEVGATNKTHRRDYEAAITGDTAMLLKVHRSNFQIVGFTVEVELVDMVELARERGVTSMIDLGSGSLLDAADLRAAGLPAEPSVRDTVASGVDLATFSGDKLLGGPQAGVIVGARDAVSAIRSHPMMRALRPDKLTMAGLEVTLSAYRDGRAREAVPTVAMLTAGSRELREKARRLSELAGEPAVWVELEVATCDSAVGGGAMPDAELASWGVALRSREPDRPGCTTGAIDRKLRAAPIPIIGRIVDDRLILDVRTIADDELDAVAEAIRAL
jgi:L-seryl-tRNA(Ser) seleniumtransferase